MTAPIPMPAPPGAAPMPAAEDSHELMVCKDLALQSTSDNCYQLGEYAKTLPPYEKARLREFVKERNPGLLDALVDELDTHKGLFKVEKAAPYLKILERTFSEYCFVRDGGGSKGEPVVYSRVTRRSASVEAFVRRHITMPPVAIPAPTPDKPNATKDIPATKWWLENQPPEYDGFGYWPGAGSEYPDPDTGKQLINTYRAAHDTPAIAGDASPFLYLLAANVPDAGDRHVFLSALAHVAQNPGVMLGWAIVFQGAPGCGKGSLLGAVVRYLSGSHNTMEPEVANLTDEKNGWLDDCTAVVVDEIGDYGKKALVQIAERLKKFVADARVPVRAMQKDMVMAVNFMTWFFTTNHKHSMLATEGERRYSHFISALQTAADIDAALPRSAWDGMPWVDAKRREMNAVRPRPIGVRVMPDNWFGNYYAWWEYCGGKEAVRAYLEQYQAGEWDRAPKTTSTVAAMDEGKGEVARLVREAVEAGEPGFVGGIVSQAAVLDLLASERVKVPYGRWFNEQMADAGFPFNKRAGPNTHGAMDSMRFPDGVAAMGARGRFFFADPEFSSWLPKNLVQAYDSAQPPL